MNEQRQEFQHIHVGELHEREFFRQYQYNRHPQRTRHSQQQPPNPAANEDDVYGVYTRQNNLGVIRLREKRYLDAANCFCQAVKYVNERSMYNCASHVNTPTSSNGDLPCNPTEDACYDAHHWQNASNTSLPMSESDEHDSFSDSFSIGSSSVGSEASELESSHSEKIDSFYLLLEEDALDNVSSNDSTSDFHQRAPQNARNNGCKQQCDEDTPPSTSSSSRCRNVTSAHSQEEETYVFRNPIIVFERGQELIRNLLPTSAISNNTSTSVVTKINKETCAKLSLISVYNMALTYHLAAMDKDSNTVATKTKKRNCLDVVTVNPDSIRPRSGKRQKQSNRSSESNTSTTTTMTPFGECNLQYHNDGGCSDCSPSKTTKSATKSVPPNPMSCPAAVDRVLLGQALAYYEIAYRILVSEHQVLVSQAMVILNNIGHIHRIMGNEDNSKKCFQRLLTTMVYLQQTGDSTQISHWDSFLTNVMDLIVSPQHSHKNFAAAA